LTSLFFILPAKEFPMSTQALSSVSDNSHAKEVVRSAQEQLSELLRQKAELMKRIGTIKQTLAGLANMFGDGVLDNELVGFLGRGTPSRQPGFTRACRVILMEARLPLSLQEVRGELQRRFPELLSRHKDPKASIATVLNRLVQYAEARCYHDENGRRVWQWASDYPTPSAVDILLNPSNGSAG
jgi:hypothetical protein